MQSSSGAGHYWSSIPRRRRRQYVIGGAVLLVVFGVSVLIGVLVPHRQHQQYSASTTDVQALSALEKAVMYGEDRNASSLAGDDLMSPQLSSSTAPSSSSPTGVNDSVFSTIWGGTSSSSSAAASSPTADLQDKIATRGWKALNSASSTTCYPSNGQEVAHAVTSSSSCTIIILTKNYFEPYSIDKEMIVNSTKIIIGHPVRMPALQPNKIERLFRVVRGGTLDVRFVTLYKGAGRMLLDGRMKLTVGGAVKVGFGGSFKGLGILFRDKRQTLEAFLDAFSKQVAVRNFGGYVFVAGGDLRLISCNMIAFNPFGTPNLDTLSVGGDYLVLAGNVVVIGVYHVAATLFQSYRSAGNLGAVLGGVATVIGGGYIGAAGATLESGYGIQFFVGGGIATFVSLAYDSTAVAINRNGAGLWGVGGGVLIQIAYLQARPWGVAAVFVAGSTFAVGGGVMVCVGCSLFDPLLALIEAGAGPGLSFTGAGEVVFVGCPSYLSTIVKSVFGVGSTWYLGGGSMQIIYCPSYTAVVADVFAGLGSQVFLGGGSLYMYNNTIASASVASAFFGGGSNVWIGGGVGVFRRNQFRSRKVVSYSTTSYSYTVGCIGVNKSEASKAIKVTNKGLTSLPEKQKGRKLSGSMDSSSASIIVMDDVITTQKLVGVQSSPDMADLSQGGMMKMMLEGGGGSDTFANYQDTMMDQFIGETDGSKDSIDTYLINGTCFMCGVDPTLSTTRLGQLEPCLGSDVCEGATTSAILQTASAAAASPQPDSSDAIQSSQFATVSNQAAFYDSVLASSQGGEGGGGSMEELPTVFLSYGKVAIFCKSDATSSSSAQICAKNDDVKAAIRSYVSQTLAGGEEGGGFNLAVSSTEIDPLFKDEIDKEYYEVNQSRRRRAQEAEAAGCGQDGPVSEYNVYFTTLASSSHQALRGVWDDLNADPTPFLEVLAKQAQSSSSFCTMTSSLEGTQAFPPINQMQGGLTSILKQAKKGIEGPELLVTSDEELTPPSLLKIGQPYQIAVSNFPQGSTVEVKLINAKSISSSAMKEDKNKPVEEGKGGKMLFTLKSFNDDDDDEAIRLAWQVDDDVAPGQYFMKATSSLGLFTYSPLFDIR